MAEQTPDFETALNELEEIVARLENGDQSLEKSLEDFERGIRLARSCSEALTNMEMRVRQLVVTDEGEIVRQPFDASEADEE